MKTFTVKQIENGWVVYEFQYQQDQYPGKMWLAADLDAVNAVLKSIMKGPPDDGPFRA